MLPKKMLQIAEDHIPDAVQHLTPVQLAFLRALADRLSSWTWTYSLEDLDLDMAVALQDSFHETLRDHDLSLRDALIGTFSCFLDSPFTM